MHAIVTKYMQIFCIAVFFDNVSCDQMPLREAKADYILIGEAACTAACITEQQERVSDDKWVYEMTYIFRVEMTSNE